MQQPRPPAQVVVKDPPPCTIPEKPLPVDTTGTMPAGTFIQVPPAVWSALIKRDLAWQAVHARAKLCERPAKP